MSKSTDMQRVDFSAPELKKAEAYAKYIESRNQIRAAVQKKLVRNKRIIGTLCSFVAVGIYAMTFNRVKEETFLDDMEEPPRGPVANN